MKHLNIPKSSIKGILASYEKFPNYKAAIGLTNQRETTVCWDAETGRPLAPAIGICL
jgi:glycerol kinase